MTEQRLKKFIQRALFIEYGFMPTLSAIEIVYSNAAGDQVQFKVENVYYSFASHAERIYHENGQPDIRLYTGAGCITRIGYKER